MSDRSVSVHAKRRKAQQERLLELANHNSAAISRLIASIRSISELPAVARHFFQHGSLLEALGIHDVTGYGRLLASHLERTDLRVFTYTTSVGTRDRMWIFVGIDNGVVALYNESKGRMWSLYRHEEPAKYLSSGRGWWVEVQIDRQEVEFSAW